MRKWNLLLGLVLLAGCGFHPTEAPAVSTQPSLTPTPTLGPGPTPMPSAMPSLLPTWHRVPRIPLVLTFTDRARQWPAFVAAVHAGSHTWNAALGEAVLVVDDVVDGTPIRVDLLPGPVAPGDMVGAVDSTVHPHAMWLYEPYVTSTEPIKRVVVLHEEGHLLGLDHSTSSSDVMYPKAAFASELSTADIARARASVNALR